MLEYKHINEKFTRYVQRYLNCGYTINSSTMGGSQGEVAKIDVVGAEIIRLMIQNFHDYNDNLDGYEIVIARPVNNVIPHIINFHNIIWNSELEILHKEQFYKIADRRKGSPIFGTKEEAVAALKIRFERWKNKLSNKSYYQITSPKIIEKAKQIICKKLGRKRMKTSDIILIRYKDSYVIRYKGESYKLK